MSFFKSLFLFLFLSLAIIQASENNETKIPNENKNEEPVDNTDEIIDEDIEEIKENVNKSSYRKRPEFDKIQTPIQRDLAERNNNINIPSSNINASSNQDPQFVSSNINPNIDIPRQSFELFINRPMENENEDEELNQEHLQNLEFNQPIWIPPDNMVIDEEDNDGLDGNNNGLNDFNNYFGNEDQITEGKTQTNNDLIEE